MALSLKDQEAVFKAGQQGGLGAAEASRIAGGFTPATTATRTQATSTTTGTGSNAILAALEKKALGGADIISSTDTRIEEAIKGIQTSQQLSSKAIESRAGRERAFQAGQFGQQRINIQEGQRGFARNNAALQQLDERTTKSLRDMDQRKEELLLQGEALAASQISQLQIQGIEFQQKAEQQMFSNLFAVSGLQLQQKAENRLQTQADRDQDARVNAIALEFGLQVQEGDTLESITQRAAPLATADRARKILKENADINRVRAETAKAQAGTDFVLDNATAAGLAATLNNLMTSADPFASQSIEAILGNIVDKHGAIGLSLVKRFQLSDADEKFSNENLRSDIQEDYNNGESLGTILGSIEDSLLMTEAQKESGRNIARELKPTGPLGTGTGAGDLFLGTFGAAEEVGASILEFFTGQKPTGITGR